MSLRLTKKAKVLYTLQKFRYPIRLFCDEEVENHAKCEEIY